ncbi:hypothetical protein [Oerskovia sp. USHLN155]|uniref:hypothetical protein n=1 Tax=Oerskovia sp. USHLN155 TaxID=3081288 RepID=UPI00301AE694
MTDESITPDELWLFFQEPAQVAGLLFAGLADESFEGSLDQLVTPESAPGWGDFSEVRGALKSIVKPGIVSRGSRALGAENLVAYIGVIPNVVEGYWVEEESVVEFAGVFTMVYYDSNRWLAHSFGQYVRPEQIQYLQ